MRCYRGETAKSAMKSVNADTGMIAVAFPWQRRRKSVAVDTVDNVDAMAAPREFSGQGLDEDAVSAEVIGRIESRYHAKSK